MAHDLHHRGRLAMRLAILGVEAVALRQLGGHIVLPDLATHSAHAVYACPT